MPLTLIIGRANAGKTGEAYARVRDAASAGREVALLMPSGPEAERAVEELAPDTPLGIRITQFDRFLTTLWTLGGDRRRLVTEAQRLALVERCIRTSGDFGEARVSGGLSRLLAWLAARLPEELPNAALAGVRRPESAARVLEAYRGCLADAGLAEPGEVFRGLAGMAPVTGESLIVVHRFADLSTVHEACVRGWARAGVDVVVTLPWEEGFAATEALDPLVRRLLRDADVVSRHAEPSTTGSAELARLDAGLFGSSPSRATDGDVTLCVASGDGAEAEAIAAEVGALSVNVPLERIAVVFRTPHRHHAALSAAFDRAGIPADFDYTLRASHVPLGAALTRLLGFLNGHAGRSELASFLRSPFSGAAPAAVDELDAEWRSRREEDRGRILRHALVWLGDPAASLLEACERVVHTPLTSTALPAWHRVLAGLLRAGHGACGDEPERALALDAALVRGFLASLGEAAELEGGAPGGADALALLDDLRVAPGGSERLGHVQVLPMDRARSRRFDAVVVGGLTQEETSGVAEDSLGKGLLAQLIRSAGMEPARRDDDAFERLLFYQVLTRARSRLVLVRQSEDSEGNTLIPSPLWGQVLDLYQDPTADTDEAYHPGAPVVKEVRRGDVPAVRSGASARAAAARSRRGVSTGRIEDAAAAEMLARRVTFSATELEAYVRCPYRWFYERVVKPERLDGELDAFTLGEAAHRALQRFYAALPVRTGSARVVPGTLKDGLRLFDAVWAGVAEEMTTPADVFEAGRLGAMYRRARALVVQDATFLPGYEPIELELSLGDREDSTGVDLGGFRLRGRVDRVDSGEAGLVVSDYKTGRARPHARFAHDGVVQLPLYAAATATVHERPVVGAFYRCVGKAEDRGFFVAGAVTGSGTPRDALDAEGCADVVDRALTRARSAADGIRAGHVAAEPVSPGACRRCGAAASCGRGSA